MARRIPDCLNRVRTCGTIAAILIGSITLSACDFRPPEGGGVPVYNNTTDPTNRGAAFVGADACRACHSEIGAHHALHGHANRLTPIMGGPPTFPAEAARAGVPNPPAGFDWADISYVLGGYLKDARFIDRDGFVLTTGVDGVDAQWNLAFPANGTTAGFVPYQESAQAPPPYEFSEFFRHTTGPQPFDAASPEFQENRPGILGTWNEPGIQCEACHGPGSNHLPNPAARDLYVNSSADQCGSCHSRAADPSVILADSGFIRNYQQRSELLASGGHASFNCTFCHDPHASATYDRANGIRNQCTDCHGDANMAFHEGAVFVRGDYVEPVTCESCHMAYATRTATSASESVVGALGQMGDTKTHIFRISTQGSDQFLTGDGSAVRRDDQGRALVTVDFACLRCHNGLGNGFEMSIETAANVASGLHRLPQ